MIKQATYRFLTICGVSFFCLTFWVRQTCFAGELYHSFDEQIAFVRTAVEEKCHVKISGKFAKNGKILLSLLEQLEKQEAQNSHILLELLNEYCYLEFYREICKIDDQEKQRGSLLRMFEDIHSYAPFGKVLSKMVILVSMINDDQQLYEKKHESMAYMLHGIGEEFLAINALWGEKKVSDQMIKNFIQILQAYATDKSVGRMMRLKKFLINNAAVLCCGVAFIVLAGVIKKFPSHVNKEIKDFKDNEFTPWFDVNIKPVLDKKYLDKKFKIAIKEFENVTKNAGKGVMEGLREALKNDPRLVADIVNNAIEGAAKNHDGEPNPNLDLVFERIINGVIIGMKKNRGGLPYFLRPPDVADEMKINKKNEEAAAKLGKK